MLRRGGALLLVTGLAACGTFLGLSGDEDERENPPATSPDARADAQDGATVSVVDDAGANPTSDAGGDAAKDGAADATTVVACNGDAGCVRYVFVTSETFVGSFGASTANAKCKSLADKSSIPDVRGRHWRAWISIQGQNALQSLQVEGTQRYRLTNDVKVADDFQDLVDNSIDNAIDRDEDGVLRSSQDVWTGTQGNGIWVSTDCNGWSDGGSNGKVGTTSPPFPDDWTDLADRPCSQQARLYCFEY